MRILSVDDEPKYTGLIKASLELDGHEVFTAPGGKTALKILDEKHIDLVFTDITMPGMDGIELLEKIKNLNNPPEVIMLTALSDTKTAVEAMKLGAFEYITKPFEIDELMILASKISNKISTEKSHKELLETVKDKFSFSSIIGTESSMQSLFKLMYKVKDLETTVLIRGESGTGKELVAKALHFSSIRSSKSFIAVNCSAIPENLLESELFGHEKGAFTGADKKRDGKFFVAEGGTLFLDEIGDMPLSVQVKLLRVLQEKEFVPIGSNKTHNCNVRILAATNRNLEEMISLGEFREDLYHRINVFPLAVPPLSSRKGDIAILSEYFLQKISKKQMTLSLDVLAKLQDYSWPGNVRELENSLERALILAGADSPITCDMFALTALKHSLNKNSNTIIIPEEGISLEAIEKNYIVAALEIANGNKTKASELLGISRRTIYSKMKTHGIF